MMLNFMAPGCFEGRLSVRCVASVLRLMPVVDISYCNDNLTKLCQGRRGLQLFSDIHTGFFLSHGNRKRLKSLAI